MEEASAVHRRAVVAADADAAWRHRMLRASMVVLGY